MMARLSQPPRHRDLLQAPVQLVRVNVGGEGSPSTVVLVVQRGNPSAQGRPEMLIVDASIKPFINLLWGERSSCCSVFVSPSSNDSGSKNARSDRCRKTHREDSSQLTECDGCAYCASIAPENFDFEKSSNTYFVSRQPATKDEQEQMLEALEDCPVDAICADGTDSERDAA